MKNVLVSMDLTAYSVLEMGALIPVFSHHASLLRVVVAYPASSMAFLIPKIVSATTVVI